MKTSSEVATLVGIKRQRIQEYEKAGIALKPKIKNNRGYWMYGEAEIERLWQIKFYQELKLEVPEIKAIFSNPNYNKHDEIENLIAGLEQKKKELESMIEIARAYNEMDILPSDLCGKNNKLEDIPYEAVVPLLGKFLSLFFSESSAEFWKSLIVDFASEADGEQWARTIENIAGFYTRGVPYNDDSLADKMSIKEALLREYLQDQFPASFHTMLLLPTEKAHVQDDYQKIFVCCGGALSYEIQSFESPENAMTAEQVVAIAETICAHHKEQRTLCPVNCDEIIEDYAILMARIEELAANFESLGEDRPEDGEHSETQKKTTAEADRKEPTAEEASVKRLYESVNWRSLAAQAAVVAVPAVAAAIYSHRRNIKLF